MLLKSFKLNEILNASFMIEADELGMSQTDLINDILLDRYMPKSFNVMRGKKKELAQKEKSDD